MLPLVYIWPVVVDPGCQEGLRNVGPAGSVRGCLYLSLQLGVAIEHYYAASPTYIITLGSPVHALIVILPDRRSRRQSSPRKGT